MAKQRPTEVIHTGMAVNPVYNADNGDNAGSKAAETTARRIRKRPKVIDATDKDNSAPQNNTKEMREAETPDTLQPVENKTPKSLLPSLDTPPPEPLTQDPEQSGKPAAPDRPVLAKRKKSKPVPPEQLSREKAASAVTSLVQQMTAKAEQSGGYLRTDDIAAMEQDFQTQVSELAQSLEHSFEAYVESREKAAWDSAREFPFWRLMVKKFSHLFGESREGRMDSVSKRMLPGFFAGLNMMIGPENVELYQERCRRVVEAIRNEEGDDFDWDSVYESTETNAIVFDALMAIAPHFDNYERRQDWLIELVNGNLAPVDEHNADDAGWELSPAGYKRFIAALYGDLNSLLANKSAYAQISRRYGSNALDAVRWLVDQSNGRL